ncbi:potassium transporter [Mycolicibacterium duvalii]|uniref:NAD(P)-binding protein n=1 Tax=Mycolicibacterium duvalii TaxID=39688 RepID=UPI000BEEB9D4|nr:NAD(P)-binding protein [Mycolicibacterium duvalii]MCV7368496.1 NAD(P)-binding protein [Mycolicibacterium duvalii]PEG41929.1 potassium transporter [Mycolicibacterium duvalii]
MSVNSHHISQTDTCDLCVVGAGIAGLNALFVASRYLGRNRKVLLIDRRPRVGGMWIDTYPYVRLHQPHPMFTAGNIGWTLNREPSYLASKDEVLDHFSHCLAEIKDRLTVDERYGWEFESAEPILGGVRVVCRAPDGSSRTIDAARLIKAYGLRVTPNEPLAFSSARVRSVSPDSCDVRTGEIAESTAPVYIVGGGKTAMDTAHTLVTTYPGRQVNLVAGSGTFFTDRDKFFPAGRRRWVGSTLLSEMAVDMCRRFDGANEQQMAAWYRATYGTSMTPQAGNFLLGVLSQAENTTIAGGVNEVMMEHLEDIVDRDGHTELLFRSGATAPVEDGSWIINCTGYLTGADQPYEPYTSSGGTVLSIQVRSATMHLTSFMGYFMTHLMFLDQLRELPLYELDMQEMLQRNKTVLPYAMFALAQYNLGLMADAMPSKVFRECGLDFDRWYPWPRRTVGAVRFMLNHRRERDHLRQVLDTVRVRCDVRCGPLSHGDATACAAAAG